MADKNDFSETRLPLPADADVGARNGAAGDPATTVIVVTTGDGSSGETNGAASQSIDWPAMDAPNEAESDSCLLYTSPSPRDQRGSRMPSSA